MKKGSSTHNVDLKHTKSSKEIDEFYDFLIRDYLAYSLYQSVNVKLKVSIDKWENYLDKSFIHYWEKAVEKR